MYQKNHAFCHGCGRKFEKKTRYQRYCPRCLKERNWLVYMRIYADLMRDKPL